MGRRSLLVAVVIVAVSLQACAKIEETAAKTEPFKIELVKETGLSRLTLEAKAAERIGIRTEKVRGAPGDDGRRTVVPYAAVLYDATGATFVYTNPKPLLFIRHAITVETVEDDVAVLSDGPPRGTKVVTTGAAELVGIEFGVGK